MAKTKSIIVPERIERAIFHFRDQRVLLDFDLADFYGVSVGRLNEAVKRNAARFPDDFMFRLTRDEFENLKSQIAISSSRWGGRRHPPYAFTEQGVAMLSSVLRSRRAVRVNIAIMRAFVRLRQVLATNAEIARRLDDLEAHVGTHDETFISVIEAIRDLMEPPPGRRKGRIGFVPS
jgi:hypothetical protein